MIVRTWRGATASCDAESYVRYLEETGLHEYRRSPGNLGVVCLRHAAGDRTEFLLVSFWASEVDAFAFAGEDSTRAVFYPEDDRFLVDRDHVVRHHDVAYIDLHGI